MQAVKAKVTRALPVGSKVETCDNSGAKVIQIISVYRNKTVKGRLQAAGVGDLIWVSVVRGRPDMRKQTMHAVIVRQKKNIEGQMV